MGFDKPDLGFVVHLGAPPSPIAYYQHIGRAGRAPGSCFWKALEDAFSTRAVARTPGHDSADADRARLKPRATKRRTG